MRICTGRDVMETTEYILSICRNNEERFDREYATLQHIATTNLSRLAPRLVKIDRSSNNPLGAPYIIKQQVDGIRLDLVWASLTPDQKVTLAQKVTNLHSRIRFHTQPYACEPRVLSSNGVDNVSLCAIQIPRYKVPRARGYRPARHFIRPSGYMESTYQFLRDCSGRWARYQRRNWSGLMNPHWTTMDEFIDSRSRAGLLSPFDRFHLTHRQLFPQNIYVTVLGGQYIEITGVTGWEHALYAPKFAACKPPYWLWAGLHAGVDAEDLVLLDLEGGTDEQLLKQVVMRRWPPEDRVMAFFKQYSDLRTAFISVMEGRSVEWDQFFAGNAGEGPS